MILVGSRWVLRPLLRLAAGTGGREMVVALILLAVLTTAGLTHAAGASMALGAFLAGILLAESEYRHEVEVDIELGTVKVLRIVAAHDVGKAINPTLVEGQIQGGVAQGLGLALMEEYLPGRTENLHDYLIPTVGDVPAIECILIEDREPLGPSGAKGVGEPGLVPTAPAILGAVHHATGVRAHQVPLLPHRLREAIVELKGQLKRKTP